LNLVGSALDASTIVLGWDVPGQPHNGIIREYRLNITEVETGRVIQDIAATTNLTVGSLHPDYSYDWIVTAFTVGLGPYSLSSRVTTPEDGKLMYRQAGRAPAFSDWEVELL
jgi:receptor-type tyrosine-protein phosphatase Q